MIKIFSGYCKFPEHGNFPGYGKFPGYTRPVIKMSSNSYKNTGYRIFQDVEMILDIEAKHHKLLHQATIYIRKQIYRNYIMYTLKDFINTS